MPTPRRRRTVNPWAKLGKTAARQMQQMQRAVARTVTKSVARTVANTVAHSVTQAAHQGKEARRVLSGVTSPVPAPTSRGGGRWQEGVWGFGPLAQRRYRLFIPPGVGAARPAPLLVLLHGCGQDAASFAACTRVAALARARHCIVLLPEQSSRANAHRCWNWFRGEAQAAAEASLLMGMIDHVCRVHPVQGDRLHLLGLSAGGAMALMLALRYPDRFVAVGSHSGAAPHLARNATQAGRVMRGSLSGHTDAQLQALRLQLRGRTPPPLLLIHGDADHVVAYDNAIASATLWLSLSTPGALPAAAAHPSVRLLRRGERRSVAVHDWRRDGRLYIRLVRVEGLGHAWSGGAASQAYADPSGPDALRIAWGFFAAVAPAPVRRRAVA
ncbi:prolyl oligopeptidase family serine peptidase [Cupriavidus gilardii]|uniref:extracellular catalytic domain type 1 short-chain-length polyhydroxyalkanoate depolymerase n=1 Tax=Cupriavidus gilardii TaxID=82541 RepID=UPI001ABDBD16|nr:PHB depolymerase family esterase [Cupriavidus gilardii]MBO4123698.1 prolyl oligopeptidase family serine peptidase [Cupriavidus gilardii]